MVHLKNEATLVWDEQKELDDRFRETWHKLTGAGKGGSHNHPKPIYRSSRDDTADHYLDLEPEHGGDAHPN
jgi:hypothetical protein